MHNWVSPFIERQAWYRKSDRILVLGASMLITLWSTGIFWDPQEVFYILLYYIEIQSAGFIHILWLYMHNPNLHNIFRYHDYDTQEAPLFYRG